MGRVKIYTVENFKKVIFINSIGTTEFAKNFVIEMM